MQYQLQPLNGRVLVEREETKKETTSGILLPEQAQEKPNEGVVKAVGWKESEQGDHSVKVGDRVMLPKYGGVEVDLDGTNKHSLISEEDLMGVLVPVDESPDADLDEPLGERQECEEEVCESCQ